MAILDVFMDGKYSSGFNSRAQWKLSFAFLPKTCDITGKRIWLKYGYKGQAMWTGPGDPVYETRWHDKAEHLIWEIKGRK
jgi:hypothetical protein